MAKKQTIPTGVQALTVPEAQALADRLLSEACRRCSSPRRRCGGIGAGFLLSAGNSRLPLGRWLWCETRFPSDAIVECGLLSFALVIKHV